MGYNSNLSKDQNKAINGKGGKRHKLYTIGRILRVIGIILLIPCVIFGITVGSPFFFVLGFFNPIAWVGALSLAFGQYFVSNWKYK